MTSTTGMGVLLAVAAVCLAPIAWWGREWRAARDREDDIGLVLLRRQRENLVPLAILAYLELITMLLSVAFGMGGPTWSVEVSVLLFGVSGAAGATGALVGFLFGIPRFSSANRTPAPTSDTTVPASPLLRRDAAAPSARSVYRPSTNLDDIADWLTKIIVGVGLTQLTSIGPALRGVSAAIRTNCGTACPSDASISSLVIISSILCFLLAYLWTRLHYNKLVARSDREVVSLLLERQEEAAVARFGLGKVETGAALMRADLTDALDPNKGSFGGKAALNGRLLRATVEPTAAYQHLYRVTLTATSTDPARPLTGVVEFHLHPTFRQQLVRQPVVNGCATLVLIAYGAFTVGALADDGGTKLELDLAELDSAPLEFRLR